MQKPETPALVRLCILINSEKERYQQALKDGKEFSDLKEIRLRIKDYKKLIDFCSQEELS